MTHATACRGSATALRDSWQPRVQAGVSAREPPGDVFSITPSKLAIGASVHSRRITRVTAPRCAGSSHDLAAGRPQNTQNGVKLASVVCR